MILHQSALIAIATLAGVEILPAITE